MHRPRLATVSYRRSPRTGAAGQKRLLTDNHSNDRFRSGMNDCSRIQRTCPSDPYQPIEALQSYPTTGPDLSRFASMRMPFVAYGGRPGAVLLLAGLFFRFGTTENVRIGLANAGGR